MPSKYCNLLIMLDRFMLFLDVPNLIRNIVPVRWPVFASHLSLIVVQHLRNWSFFSTYKTAQVPFPGEAISQSHILLRLESLTICHLILHLRQVHLADGSSSTDSRLRSTFLRFASNVVGNLGAPLELDREFDVESEPDDFRPRSSDNPLADSLAHAPNVSSMRNVEPSRYAIVHALFFLFSFIFFTFCRSPAASTIKLDETFDDLEYGRRRLSVFRRTESQGLQDEDASVARLGSSMVMSERYRYGDDQPRVPTS